MTWPLPSLPNPIAKAGKAPPGGSAPAQGGGDPLTALWMLSQTPTANPTRPPAQGFGSQYQMARAPQQAGTPQANYDQAAATPASDAANPFSALDKTYRHEAFAQRFPWLGV